MVACTEEAVKCLVDTGDGLNRVCSQMVINGKVCEICEVRDEDFRPSSLIQDFFFHDFHLFTFTPLSASEMEQLRVSPAAMLEDEVTWLDNFEPNRTAECETSEADNILLAGHLRLIKTLLSLCGAEKEVLGTYCFISLCGKEPQFSVTTSVV